MKGIAVVAVILGAVGTVLGVIALVEGGGFDDKTLNLTGGKETRVEYRAPVSIKDHPLGDMAWTSNQAISGDASGEYTRTCVPLATDEIQCDGAFLLDDGDIEVDLTEEAERSDPHSDGAIIGGTGAYDGAVGSYDIDWKKNTYTLNMKLPK